MDGSPVTAGEGDASAVVSLRGMTKRFRDTVALDGIDLDIRRGEIFALLGPNGAGKTTLIGIVAGLLRATSGTATVLGRDVVSDYRFTRRSVGLVPQEINFDPFFTVEETLRIQAGYFGVRLGEERLVEILRHLDLLQKRSANTRSLSGGMKRRMLVAKALVHEPRVLFLDEPTAGVDVELRQHLFSYIRLLRDRGTTIILTTHYLEEAEALADRIGVIDRGRLLVVEDKPGLIARHAVKTMRVTLPSPLASLPPGLASLGAVLAASGRILEFPARGGAEFGPALAALAEAGMRPTDIETSRTRLEDVVIDILRRAAAEPEGRSTH